jgi:predicted DsbA family dithiol-disulfide isomerase
VDIEATLNRLAATAQQLNLPFGDRRMTYNSRSAQELGKWAEAQGRGEAFHRAVFHAYFAEGLNIALNPVLLDIAEKCGLDRTAADDALQQRAYRTAVDADWQRSYEKGVTAVPTFRLNDQVLVGAQPYEALAAFLTRAKVPARHPLP